MQSQVLKKLSTERQDNEIRSWLRDEFNRRVSGNPAYSLRAFALYLKVDQSHLSKVLAGKLRFSDKTVESIIAKLGFPKHQIESLSSEKIKNYVKIHEEEFSFLSDWLPFAIIELAKTRDFDSSPAKMAKLFNVHIEEVRAALSRLERFGYIQIDGEDFEILRPTTSWSTLPHTTEARKNYQRKIGQKSLEALENIDYSLRDHGSMTVAINKKKIPELKKKLEEFRQELGIWLQEEDELDEVYQFSMNFFPLSNGHKKKEKK